MPKLKFGFVGAGMVSRYSAKNVASHEEATIVAAFDPSAKRLGELCDENDIPRRYADLDAFLADDELDAVYVAVPNKFHASIAKQVLKSGRHLLLDKPFALNYAEAKSVVDVAEASGKKFCVGMNQRFPAGRQRIRKLVKDGELGEIYHAKGYWLRRSGIPRLQTWFGHKALSGGGCMLDIGVHMLDVTLWMADNFEPVSVVGKTHSKFGPRGLGEGGWGLSDRDPSLTFDVDDFANAFITFKNGMTVSLDVSWAAHTEVDSKEGAELFGTEAGASIEPAKLFRRPDPTGEYEILTLGDTTDQASLAVPVEYEHCDRFHNFINHIFDREELCCKPSESLVVQKVLDAVYESSRTGKQVMIDA